MRRDLDIAAARFVELTRKAEVLRDRALLAAVRADRDAEGRAAASRLREAKRRAFMSWRSAERARAMQAARYREAQAAAARLPDVGVRASGSGKRIGTANRRKAPMARGAPISMAIQ
jgi:hypothetical protein